MKRSAGILMFRKTLHKREYLLVHPGGPFWRNKDSGAWGIPKGEYEDQEEPLIAAIREFKEETGSSLTGQMSFYPLGEIKQKGGKKVIAWAVEGNIDPEKIRCNSFEMEWPPHSGKLQSFPEVDKAGYFTIEMARQKILESQIPFLEQVENLKL